MKLQQTRNDKMIKENKGQYFDYYTCRYGMQRSDELRRILTIISDLTHNETNSCFKDTEIIAQANRQQRKT